jgi:hypothetical protein
MATAVSGRLGRTYAFVSSSRGGPVTIKGGTVTIEVALPSETTDLQGRP